MELYERIQAACDERGKTVAGLERELGWNRGTIQKWEDHSPSVTRVKAVADMLETTVDELLEGG